MAGRRNQVRKQCVQNMLEAQIIEKKQHVDAFGLGKITASGCMSELEQISGLCKAAVWLGLLLYLASPAAAHSMRWLCAVAIRRCIQVGHRKGAAGALPD